MWKRKIGGLWLACVLVTNGVAYSQESTPPDARRAAAYSMNREGTLVGTVIAYTPNAQSAPRGAHVSLQTSAGTIDVQVGDARFLAANHFPIEVGDSLRIIGENLAYGTRTQFVARIVQNGTKALEVRSARGIPLAYAAPKDWGKRQGGIL